MAVVAHSEIRLSVADLVSSAAARFDGARRDLIGGGSVLRPLPRDRHRSLAAKPPGRRRDLADRRICYDLLGPTALSIVTDESARPISVSNPIVVRSRAAKWSRAADNSSIDIPSGDGMIGALECGGSVAGCHLDTDILS